MNSRLVSGFSVVAAVFGLVVGCTTGCSSTADEKSGSSSAALEETCQPLVKSSKDVVCTHDDGGLAKAVSDFVRNDVGTCAACIVSVASIIASDGATLPVVLVTGAGCYGCAAWVNDQLGAKEPQYQCSLTEQLTAGCNSACAEIGAPYATATMRVGDDKDVTCSCGTSRNANVCCSTGTPSGVNGQRRCDPDAMARQNQGQNYSCPLGANKAVCGDQAHTTTGGTLYCNPYCTTDCIPIQGAATNWSLTPPSSCSGAAAPPASAATSPGQNAGTTCPTGYQTAQNCKHTYDTLTCDVPPSNYGPANVNATFPGASLMRCHPTQDRCGQVFASCTRCEKNFDGQDDKCL